MRFNFEPFAFVYWILSMLAYVLILYLSWIYFKKRGIPNLIVASFDIPQYLSPALCRYLYFQKIDCRSLVASIVNLHIQGYLKIEEQEGIFSLTKNHNKKSAVVTVDELVVLETLFSSNKHRVVLNGEYNDLIAKTYSIFRECITSYIKKEHWFISNVVVIILNIMIAYVAYFASVVILFPYGTISFSFFLALSITLLFLVVWSIYESIKFLRTIFALLLYLSFALLESSMNFHWKNLFFIVPFSLLFVGITWVYAKKMKVLTRRGIREKVKVLGLYRYLKVAEEHRYAKLNIKNGDVNTSEILMSYAMALNLEINWSNSFENAISKALKG